MKNLITLAILLLCLSSCRSKKTFTEEKQTVKIDTIYQEKKVVDTVVITKREEITKPVYFETEIPCNEDQTGTVGSGNNFTKYQIKDGKIFLQTNLDSISNSWQTHYRAKFVNDSINIRKQLEDKYKSQQEITKYVWPWWLYALIIYGILASALNLYQKFRPI